MLLRTLKTAFTSRAGSDPGSGGLSEQADAVLHGRLRDRSLVQQLKILFDGTFVCGRPFLELYAAALHETNTGMAQEKWHRRAQRAYQLTRYFEHTLTLKGPRAECGVAYGFSGLLLCKVAALHRRGYAGEDFHLFDSFEGLSDIREQDIPSETGTPRHQRGDMAASEAAVRASFRDYPGASIHRGWIPQVLSAAPEARWSFVHVDVDLYEPTLAALEYFVPRMSAGGIIVNDDYASPGFPGAARAWDEYCAKHGVRSYALDSGQAAIIA